MLIKNKRDESRFQQNERQSGWGDGAEWLARKPWNQTFATYWLSKPGSLANLFVL